MPSTSTQGHCADPAGATSDSGVDPDPPAPVVEEHLMPSTSTSGDSILTFAQLLPVPHRDRPLVKRPRIKPPSYELTSVETLKHISDKLKPKKSGKEKASKKDTLNKSDKFVKKNICQKKKSDKKVNAAATSKGTGKGKGRGKYADTDSDACAFCQWVYGDISDPLNEDQWEMCVNCKQWYHHTCANVCGKFRVGSFCCDNCI